MNQPPPRGEATSWALSQLAPAPASTEVSDLPICLQMFYSAELHLNFLPGAPSSYRQLGKDQTDKEIIGLLIILTVSELSSTR
jgi:hypothetical protein